jgi:hemerythrin
MDKAREILFYLFEWLRSHLLEEDKNLVAFLNSKGVD